MNRWHRGIFCLLMAAGAASGAQDPLLKGVVGYMGFEGNLSVVAPHGEDHVAEFSRHGEAFTDDLAPVVENEPRYVPGRFGTGLLVEPGSECNHLPPAVAGTGRAKDGGPAYAPVGGAALEIAEGRPGDGGAAGRPSGLRRWLVARCAKEADGAAGRQAASIIQGSYTLSLFARSGDRSADGGSIRLQLAAADGSVIGSSDVPVAGEWRRVEANFEVERFTRDVKQQKKRDVFVRVLATRPDQTFHMGGLVLETRGGYSYAGTAGASSWLPGYGRRASEGLGLDGLRHSFAGRTGSVSFWAQTRGRKGQYWRTLFEIPGDNRWQPFLQLSLRSDSRLHLGRRGSSYEETTAPAAVEPGAWRHYAVTWTADAAVMYLDGKRAGGIGGLNMPEVPPSIRFGCAGPDAAANAVIDEAVLFDRALDAAEVAILAARREPLAGDLVPALAVRPARFIGTIARTVEPQSWLCEVVNRSRNDVRDVGVVFRIGDRLTLSRRIRAVKAGAAAPVEFRFVADLAPGRYPLIVTAEAGGGTAARFARTVEITPAAEPFENLQVAPWGWDPDPGFGVTFAGGDVESAMRKGLWWSPLWHYMGYPRHVDGEDVVHGMNDVPGLASFTSSYMMAQVEREGVRLSRLFAAIPAMRGFTPNSEMQWIWQHDYSEEKIAWVRRRFGIDLNAWRYPPAKGGADAFQEPYGRLKPRVAGIALPPDRIIPTDMGFYAYHRWFHGPTAPTESYLGQRLSAKIHERRPDILTIQEPILRRPAVRAFESMSVAQEWFYYENPMSAVMIQEQLNAAVRGTDMRPSGMPSFLFKAGGAAPYNSVATADMYHITAWLCALQPIRMFTYYNLGVITRPDFETHYHKCMTKAEIDRLFGTPTPTREQVLAVLKEKPDLAGRMMPWTPELAAVFKRFHLEEAGPLGSLIPRWRNRPRRVAVLKSFASQLFDGVRWPSATWLENCAVYGGVPFDVLYDADFEGSANPLDPYRMLIVSGAVCLTRPVHERITSFLKKGGAVVVDDRTLVDLPGAVKIPSTDSFAGYEAARTAAEEELRRRNVDVKSPEYVEAMTSALSSGRPAGPVEPAFRKILDAAVVPEARSLTPDTWLNLLEAAGANYVGVVNNLRVRGPMFGHFGTVRETGVAQKARVEFDPGLGTVAYDLLARAPVSVVRAGRVAAMDLDLPAGGARVIMLLPRPVGRLTASAAVASASWGDHAGREVRVEARLVDADGRPVPGLVPCTVTVAGPDGARSDFSRHAVLERGSLELRFPVDSDARPGLWKATVLERAAGGAATAEFRL